MKTKFKDFLLYSLACVGAVSLFLSAYQPQESATKYLVNSSDGAGYPNLYIVDNDTGEVRYFEKHKERVMIKD
tara:strand:- start:68 stop:286 length:219 start_codon:yes stop_codon:yes gene_type:complete